MAQYVTQNAISRIFNNETNFSPIIQMVDIKKIVTSNNGERYRLVISDGDRYIQGMLATQITNMVTNGQLKKNAIVRLDEFVCNTINGRRICIVIKCGVQAHANAQIGNPTNIQPGGSPNRGNQNNNQNRNNNNNQPPPRPQQTFNQQQNQNNQNNRNQMQMRGNNNNNNNNNGNNNNNFNGGNRNNNNNNNNNRRYNNNNNYNNNGNNNNNNNNYQRNNNSDSNPNNFQPIATLNPYQNNWRIKVRVTGKGEVRNWHSAKGEGKVFGFDLMDSEGGEIHGSCFNEAVDQWFPVLNVNSVYLISRGRVTVSRKAYTHIRNDYAITLNQHSEVTPVDDDSSIQNQSYNYVPINEIVNCEVGSFVDVLAIVLEYGDVAELISQKTQKEVQKRSLTIMDHSGKSIEFTLWGEQAKKIDTDQLDNYGIISIKGSRVNEYGGRSLSSGYVVIDPTSNEATRLRAWWNNNQNNVKNNMPESLTIARGKGQSRMRLTIGEAQETLASTVNGQLGIFQADGVQFQGENSRENPQLYFDSVATITTIVHNSERPPWYKAAPHEEAKNAKVEPSGDGQWYCAKNNTTYGRYVPRYVLRFLVQGSDGQMWLTAFNDAAEQILGVDAVTTEKYLMEGNNSAYEAVFNDACFKKFTFRIRAKSDTYQDEQRIRYDCIGATPIVFPNESQRLVDLIKMIKIAKGESGNNNNNNNNSNSNSNYNNNNNNNYNNNNNNYNNNNNFNNNFGNNNNNNNNNNSNNNDDFLEHGWN